MLKKTSGSWAHRFGAISRGTGPSARSNASARLCAMSVDTTIVR